MFRVIQPLARDLHFDACGPSGERRARMEKQTPPFPPMPSQFGPTSLIWNAERGLAKT